MDIYIAIGTLLIFSIYLYGMILIFTKCSTTVSSGQEMKTWLLQKGNILEYCSCYIYPVKIQNIIIGLCACVNRGYSDRRMLPWIPIIARLCHTGHGFLEFSLTLLNSEEKYAVK